MAAKKGVYQIPFDNDGNQKHYPESWKGLQWKDNYEFDDELHFTTYGRGRSAAYFIGAMASNGMTVNVFITDFMDLMPHMVHGKVTGKFSFVKRGQNYGCKLVEAK